MMVKGNNAEDHLVFNGGTVNATDDAGNDFIAIAVTQLNRAGMSINGGGCNRRLFAGTNTIPYSSFTRLRDIQELDCTGTGVQSVALGAHAHAALGSQITVYANTASSLTIDVSEIGSTGATATGGPGNDTFIAGPDGAHVTGGAGANTFEVGLGSINGIADFIPGIDRTLLQASRFMTFSQIQAKTMRYNKGIDSSTSNGCISLCSELTNLNFTLPILAFPIGNFMDFRYWQNVYWPTKTTDRTSVFAKA